MKIEREGTIRIKPDGFILAADFEVTGGTLPALQRVVEDRVLLAAQHIYDARASGADRGGPGMSKQLDDWTVKDGCANSSDEFERLTREIARLIRDQAHQLLHGNTEAASRLILAQLAHVHGLAPKVNR